MPKETLGSQKHNFTKKNHKNQMQKKEKHENKNKKT